MFHVVVRVIASIFFILLVFQSILDIFSNFFRLFTIPDWLEYIVATSEALSGKLSYFDNGIYIYIKYYVYLFLCVILLGLALFIGQHIHQDITRTDLK